MWDWAIIVALYLFTAGVFRLLGGLGSAGDALAGWGRRRGSAPGDRSPYDR